MCDRRFNDKLIVDLENDFVSGPSNVLSINLPIAQISGTNAALAEWKDKPCMAVINNNGGVSIVHEPYSESTPIFGWSAKVISMQFFKEELVVVYADKSDSILWVAKSNNGHFNPATSRVLSTSWTAQSVSLTVFNSVLFLAFAESSFAAGAVWLASSADGTFSDLHRVRVSDWFATAISICSFKGQLCMFHIGLFGVYWKTSDSNGHFAFGSADKLSVANAHSVAVYPSSDFVYACVTDASGAVFLARSSTSAASSLILVQQQEVSGSNPSLAQANGVLYLSYIDDDKCVALRSELHDLFSLPHTTLPATAMCLSLTAGSDGLTCLAQVGLTGDVTFSVEPFTSPVVLSGLPSAVVVSVCWFNGEFTLLFTDASHTVWVLRSVGGSFAGSSTAQKIAGNWTASSLSLSVFRAKLWCAFIGSSGELFLASSSDGTFEDNQVSQVLDWTGKDVSICDFLETLCLVYTGLDDSVYFSNSLEGVFNAGSNTVISNWKASKVSVSSSFGYIRLSFTSLVDGQLYHSKTAFADSSTFPLAVSKLTVMASDVAQVAFGDKIVLAYINEGANTVSCTTEARQHVLSDAEKLALIVSYSPTVALARDEVFFPCSVEWGFQYLTRAIDPQQYDNYCLKLITV